MTDARVWSWPSEQVVSAAQQGDTRAIATLIDGLGNQLGPAGGKRGTVTGTFFHAIARQSA